MLIITVSEFRRDTAKIIQTIREQDEFAVITRHGKPTAVVLDYKRYDKLMEKEKRAECLSNS